MTLFKKCKDSRNCFAKTNESGCTVLHEVYADGECPFCKEEQFMTQGKYYPYSISMLHKGGVYSHHA